MLTLTLTTNRLRALRRSLLVVMLAMLVSAPLAYWHFSRPSLPARAITPAAARGQENYGRVPLSFEVNQGQVDEQVKFLTRTQGQTLFLTAHEAVLDLRQKNKASALRMKLVNARSNPVVSGTDKLAGTTNYFLGNDPKAWRTNIPTYGKVKYESVYAGIDLVYYGNQQQLEYDFLVAPGADPKSIQLEFAGADQMRLDEQGNLALTTTGEVVQHKPVIYQEADGQRVEVAGNYVLQENGQVGFAVGEYDASKTLVIDPILSYATFFGSSSGDGGFGASATDIKVDHEGNAYITGTFRAAEFPFSTGAVRPLRLYRDEAYAFITKFNPQGSGLVYSAVIGGTSRPGAITPFALAIDDEGCAYLTGWNAWRDFPITRGVFASLGSIFVTKVNPTGTELVFSTILGGDGFSEEGSGITVDRDHNVYVTGKSDSQRFPVTPNAYQKQNAGWTDGFVVKLKPDASALLFSTLIGGGLNSTAVTPVVDAEGNVYFAGDTQGIADGRRSDYSPFPTTPGAFLSSTDPQILQRGGAYVAKLNATGSELLFSTMVLPGGAARIALDPQGNVHVGAATRTNDAPITPGAYRTRGGTEDPNNPFDCAVMMKFSPDMTRLIYSTYVNSYEAAARAFGFAVDAEGCAYVSGMAPERGFPFTTAYPPGASPFPDSLPSTGGGFVTKLKADGSGIVYSAYLPDARPDGRLAVDAQGNAYLTGTAREQLPTTENAYQFSYDVISNALCFVAKIANVTTPESPLPLIYPLPITENPDPTKSYRVGGRIKDEWGSPVAGVTITINATNVPSNWLGTDWIKELWTIGPSNTMSLKIVTDSAGYYSTRFPATANYTLTPSKTGYTFNVPNATLNRVGKWQTVGFTATNTIPPRVAVNVSAASYERGLAYHTITSAFGSDLATKTVSAATLPLPTNLGGTTVLVRDLTGAERYASLFFVSPTQVNYLLPAGTYTGRALVTIRNANGGESSEVIQVGDTAPGLFSADATGRGVAAATLQRVKANGTQNIETVSQFDVTRGQMMALPIDLGAAGDSVYLALYGTGIRNRRQLENVSATVGGIRARVMYAGSQNGYAGLDQINIMLPRELAGRGEVDVVLNVEDKPANVVKIKIK